jgi:hypothetical protein
LKVTTYKWENVKEIEEIYKISQGDITLSEYVFTMKNNKEIKIPYRLDIREVSDHITDKIEEYHLKVTSNEDELYY